jgi:hypothetical protein
MQHEEQKILAEMPQKFAERNTERYTIFQHWLQFGIKKIPSQTWITTQEKLLEKINDNELKQTLIFVNEFLLENTQWFYQDKQTNFVKGFLWTLKKYQNESFIYPIIQKIIEKAFSKNPFEEFALLSSSIARTGLHILVDFQSLEAFKVLYDLSQNIKEKKYASKILEQTFQEFEQKTNTKINVWEDKTLALLTFDIQNKKYSQQIGDYTFELLIENYQKISTKWLKNNGKTQESIPAVIKKDFHLELEKIKDITTKIRKNLQNQRHKLENSYKNQSVWKAKDWQNIYQFHPLFSIVADGLIWIQNQKNVFILYQNECKNIDNQIITLQNDDEISLWHPAIDSVENTLRWRNFLFDNQILQPFKQAFREVYILTDAEKKTKNYSLRFAAHILERRKLLALLAQRDWYYDFQIDQAIFKSKNMIWQVEWTMEYASNQYISSQGVSFTKNNQKVDLVNIEPVIFSEMMRDIDLFVAVCSIGSDPYWQGENRWQAYWDTFAFGEKSDTASAKIRKEILEKIVPNLTISHLCSFEKNFLVVKGKKRTYKINMGSGNILMKPNDEYLCIVPEKVKMNPAEHIFLPFDKDAVLSLILSKAFLLVNDDTIEDKTILSQINRDGKW